MSRSLVGWLLACAVCAAAGCDEAATGTEPLDSAQAAEVHPGAQTYQEFCFSCHTPGLSGAPRLGDVEAWAPRIAKGQELLLQATIEGMPPAMPARGLCMSCSDEELAAAVDFMVQKSQ